MNPRRRFFGVFVCLSLAGGALLLFPRRAAMPVELQFLYELDATPRQESKVNVAGDTCPILHFETAVSQAEVEKRLRRIFAKPSDWDLFEPPNGLEASREVAPGKRVWVAYCWEPGARESAVSVWDDRNAGPDWKTRWEHFVRSLFP